MNELESIVKSVVYGGIGAAATLVEKGSDLARTLVEKGHETVRANQDTAEDIKRRVREFCDKLMNDGTIDASKLSVEQRAELRRQLDELDELDAQCRMDDEPAVPTDDAVPVYEPEEASYTAPDEE